MRNVYEEKILLFFMLYTKCIYAPKGSQDGVRISVMSRHTLSDGVTKDPRISPEIFDEHLVLFGPRAQDIGDYYRRGLSWEAFAQRYLAYLRETQMQLEVEKLGRRAFSTDITLLCVEESAEKCHRRLLAEECLWHVPSLHVKHV